LEKIKDFEQKTGATVVFQGQDWAQAISADLKSNCEKYLPIGEANTRFTATDNYLSYMPYSFNITIKDEMYSFSSISSQSDSNYLSYDNITQTGRTQTLVVTNVDINQAVNVNETVEILIASEFSYEVGSTKGNGKVYIDRYNVTYKYQDDSQIEPLGFDFFEKSGLKGLYYTFFDEKSIGLKFLE
jgi:hypothetical protein